MSIISDNQAHYDDVNTNLKNPLKDDIPATSTTVTTIRQFDVIPNYHTN